MDVLVQAQRADQMNDPAKRYGWQLPKLMPIYRKRGEEVAFFGPFYIPAGCWLDVTTDTDPGTEVVLEHQTYQLMLIPQGVNKNQYKRVRLDEPGLYSLRMGGLVIPAVNVLGAGTDTCPDCGQVLSITHILECVSGQAVMKHLMGCSCKKVVV